MSKNIFGIMVFFIGIMAASPVFAVPTSQCLTVKDGLYDDRGKLIVSGSDQWGYNYQARSFSGLAENFLKPILPALSGEVYLDVKWSDSFLSNKDCDEDGKLDKHYGYPSFFWSNAWLTYRATGDKWSYFAKIVAAPPDLGVKNGMWYNSRTDTYFGPVIWGEFMIIDEKYTDNGPAENYRNSLPLKGFGGYLVHPNILRALF